MSIGKKENVELGRNIGIKFSILRAFLIGNALEYYDFFLYNFFVSLISPLFFPSTDPQSSLMMGLGVFAVGFLARPIGALVFGHLGDKYGRKKALINTLFLMAISVVGIGLLPSYEKIGIYAPLLLIFFRILQGFSAGGEVNGTAILSLEQTHPSRQGLVGALINSSAGIGAIGATSMGILFTNDLMPEWAWRIPFCLGGLVAFAGLYLRRSLFEPKQVKIAKVPFFDVIKNYPISFMKAICVGGFLHVPFYIIVGYMNPTMHAKGLINSTELMFMNTAVTLMGVLVMPLVGYFSDKVGSQRLMLWGALGQMIFAIPIFMIYNKVGLIEILFTQIGFFMVAELFISPSNAYLNTLFPPECRYSGISIGACLGMAIFGGTTPLICNQLSLLISPIWGPSLYLIIMTFVGVFSVKENRSLLKETRNFPSATGVKATVIGIFCFFAPFHLNASEGKPVVIFLNGTSSAGKTSIAIKLIEQLEEPYLRVGVDWYSDVFNPKYQCGGKYADIGHRFVFSEDEKGPLTTIKAGPVGLRLCSAAHRAMKVFLDHNFNLIIDEVLFDDVGYQDYLSLLQEYRVYFIAIKPPIEIAQQREEERGNRGLGLARGLYDIVYSNKVYDLEIDSSKLNPDESARLIINFIKTNPHSIAFNANVKKELGQKDAE